MKFSVAFTLIAVVVVSVGCRTYSPVERHFLRVPALAASAVATPDRGRWLKNSHKVDGFKETALARHWIPLTYETKPPRVQAPPGEMAFFPKSAGSKSGIVALNWQDPAGPEGATRLYLLRTLGGKYVMVPLEKVLPEAETFGRFTLQDSPGTITAWKKTSGRQGGRWVKGAVLLWSNGGWQVKR